MDEVKPVAWAFRQDWGRFQADGSECRLLPNFYWGDDLAADNTYAPLYDQQAIDALRRSLEFYRRRSEALQAIQHHMRDPERKAVCDILANGQTYVYADTAK